MTAKQVQSSKKKRGDSIGPRGQVHVQATYNNTIVNIADQNGNTVSWSSAGKMGFRGPKKATAYAASVIVKDATGRAVEIGIKEVDVYVKGIGSGREAAIRALNANGLHVMSIRDITPIPHNGCRPKRLRRV